MPALGAERHSDAYLRCSSRHRNIHIDVPAVKFKELASDAPGESSSNIHERVVRARRVQLDRSASERIFCNAQMSTRLTRKYCAIDAESKGVAGERDHKVGVIGLRLRSNPEGEPDAC